VQNALRLARLGNTAQTCVKASLQGYATPSTLDVGAASVCLRVEGPCQGILAEQGSIALAVRRSSGESWLPAIAGVPGHHVGRDEEPRNGLLEVMLIARPTTLGGITFLPDESLRAWAPVGIELELAPLKRMDDFHIDDGSGPWLRDRICITSSEAEDFALASGPGDACGGDAGVQQLLAGSGLCYKKGAVSAPPMDEWDLTRTGQYHREVTNGQGSM